MPPLYLVVLCEGRRCRPVQSLDDAPVAEADAVACLAGLATRLRAAGAVGHLLLLDGERKRVVAARTVWPPPGPSRAG